mmetsp:Transcript_12496/g.25096  ORF Transcript_12496/g.25096 Transcript_12496/m.25096 type:complete len:99 (+) Transcript_12496:123-419(+)
MTEHVCDNLDNSMRSYSHHACADEICNSLGVLVIIARELHRALKKIHDALPNKKLMRWSVSTVSHPSDIMVAQSRVAASCKGASSPRSRSTASLRRLP